MLRLVKLSLWSYFFHLCRYLLIQKQHPRLLSVSWSKYITGTLAKYVNIAPCNLSTITTLPKDTSLRDASSKKNIRSKHFETIIPVNHFKCQILSWRNLVDTLLYILVSTALRSKFRFWFTPKKEEDVHHNSWFWWNRVRAGKQCLEQVCCQRMGINVLPVQMSNAPSTWKSLLSEPILSF